MDADDTFLSQTVRYVPEWFPGAGWKTKAKRYAKLLDFMTETPHQFVKDQMVSVITIKQQGPLHFLLPLFIRGYGCT